MHIPRIRPHSLAVNSVKESDGVDDADTESNNGSVK